MSREMIKCLTNIINHMKDFEKEFYYFKYCDYSRNIFNFLTDISLAIARPSSS